MLVQFNKEMLHVQIICGTLEEYKPTEEIKDLQKRVESLKKVLDKFQKETVFPALQEIEKVVNEINDGEKKKSEG